MNKPPNQSAASFMTWLAGWRQSIESLELIEGTDLTDIDYQDILIKRNITSLNALLNDELFINLLTQAYNQLRIKVGDASAQFAVRQFLMDACWICVHKLNRTDTNTKAAPGDLKKDWLHLNRATIKLAKQIEALSSSYGSDSQPYLEARLQAGNPVGYIFKRKNSWQSALPRQSTQRPIRRLSELLRCFASDVAEEAALMGIAIETRRQKGGAQAGLHFEMDGLASASAALSAAVPPQPNFALVNRVIAALLDPADGFDSGTVRRRYKAAQRRRTAV